MAWIEDHQFLLALAFFITVALWPFQSRSYQRIRQQSGELSSFAFLFMYVACTSFAAFLTEEYALDAIEDFGDSIRSITSF